MRRLIGPTLVGLGVFLIVAAGLVRFYAYPALAKVPGGYESTTKLEATDAEVFNSDPEVLAPETTDLSIESYTVQDTEADTPDGVVVWHNAVTITREDGTVFQQTRERAPFDEVTGAALDCEECGSWTEVAEGEQVDVAREGQVYKFPFNTQKQDYPVWDSTLGEAVTATYEGEEQIQGVTVYKFVQHIERTDVDDREVPGAIFGVDEPSVQADMMYGITRTFYVEPVTGSSLNRIDERTQELEYDGVTVPAFNGTVQYTEEQVDELVDDTGGKAALLGGMRFTFPLGILVLGVVALASGLLLDRRAQRQRQADGSYDDRTLVSA